MQVNDIPAADTFLLVHGRISAAGEQQITRALSDRPIPTLSCWRGVRDQDTCLWMLQVENPRRPLLIPPSQVEHTLSRHSLRQIRSVGGPWMTAVPVANFVMRSLEPASVDGLLPLLDRQIESIFAQSDCKAFALFQVDDSPSLLLGITGWADFHAFDAYAGWASSHPWADTITPNTISVPLRLLARRRPEEAGGS